MSYECFLKSKECQRIAGGCFRQSLRGFAAALGHDPEDVWQMARLVATVPGLRLEVAWQEVWRIGLEHQPVGRNAADELAQVPATALIADPAGDADREPQLQVVVQLLRVAREAMCDPSRDACAVVAQDRQESVMRIALVQEHGPSELRGQFELTAEHALLIGVRREIPEEVEAALAGRADLLCPHQLAQGRDVRVVELACVVRVDAGGRTEPRRVASHEFDRSARALDRAAGDDHPAHAGIHGRLDHVVAVLIEAVVSEVQSDVD